MGVGAWTVLELSSRSEGENPSLIQQSIQNTLGGDLEVFIPAAVTEIGGDKIIHYLINGYAFIRGDFTRAVLRRLENTRYIQAVLSDGVELASVPDAAIRKMRKQLLQEIDQGIGVGDKVLITTGPYRNIEAEVITDITEMKQVQVLVRLRSKETIQTIPRSGLKVLERAIASPLHARLMGLRIWLRNARPVLNWKSGGTKKLTRAFAHLSRFENWLLKGHHLYAVVTTSQNPARVTKLWERFATLRQITDWLDRARWLYTFVASYHGLVSDSQVDQLRSKFVELLWFDDIQERIKTLRREVDVIGHRAAKRRKGGGDVKVIQNVVVDGHNLAFRCLYAPGMSELFDDQGRPTGVILGVMKGLGALRKRYPEARIYMTWDGSNQRRKSVFPEYKANRKTSNGKAEDSTFDQLDFLRTLLPLFGVLQAWNPEEEADDVIAALVRGPLAGQHNLIFSTDRDLLQLVSDTTMMLTPRVGSRREVFYDLAAVEKVFGVPPKTLVQLRAFYGDPSDNIPGVPRVPKKVLRKLVQAYGSVDGVYKSSLTGLTKGQYDRLRVSEPQVRINVGLMCLEDVDVSVIDPDVDPSGAAKRLRSVAIQPDPLVDAFFGRRTETADT